MNVLARPSLLALALLTVLVPVASGVDKGGPSPGIQFAGQGISSADAALRYATRNRAGVTTVTAFDADGRTVRRGTLTGVFGIPFVAFDGSLGGLSHDGRRLVVASRPTAAGVTRFAVLSADSLAALRIVSLKGSWSFDALSPSGRRLYLVEHSPEVTYRVRAYDVVQGTLLREAVIDPRLGGRSMTGAPVTRATDARGVWVYTLYQKPRGLPFVHALDTVRGKALCIELPWRGNQGRLFDVRMRVQGRTLVLGDVGGAQLATIDRRAFVVHAHHNPLQPRS